MSEELIKRLREKANRQWRQIHDDTADLLREAADALSRPATAVQVPEGWALVPYCVSDEMTNDVFRKCGSFEGSVSDIEELWAVMLAAAPAPATVATEAVAQAVGDLLAVIHRDGGHYQAEHGIEKAARDAIAKYNELRATLAYMGSPFEAVAQGGGVDAARDLLAEILAEADNFTRRTGKPVNGWPERVRALLTAADAGAGGLEPVEGDLLPPVGSKVLIHLASPDAWVEHTVAGYYVWGDLGGNKHLHRVFVRVVSNSGYPNARMLHEVRPLPAAPAIANQGADRDACAKAMYRNYVDNCGVHCNRLPTWHELSEEGRNEWRKEAIAKQGEGE